MRKILPVLAALLFLLPAVSWAKPVDVGVVLGLLDAGVSDASIQRYVQRNHLTFDLSAEDLEALKKAGASDSLIAFLQDREEGAPEGQTQPAPESTGGGYAESYQAGDYGDYGVASYVPSYSFGLYFGYPYYYSGFYYPYYYPYYYPSYYGGYYYPYYGYHYPYHGHYYPYYGGGRGSGTGVVSYWYGGHGGRGTSRPPASGPPPAPHPQGSPHGAPRGGHGGGGHGGGGHGGRR